MSTFAVPPLRLPVPNIRAAERALPAEDVEPSSVLDADSRPVPATHRDLTIPDVVPLPHSSWRRPPRIRGRAS